MPTPTPPTLTPAGGGGGVTHNTTKDDKTPDQKQLLPGCLFWTGQHLSLPTLNYPNVSTSSCYHIEWPGKPGLPGYTGAGTLINKQYLPSKTQSYQEPPSQNMALLNSGCRPGLELSDLLHVCSLCLCALVHLPVTRVIFSS